MRLMYDAEVPNYDEGIRLYEKTRKKRGADDEGESEEVEESEESEEEEEELFVCPSCRGTFDARDADAHEVKCPVRHFASCTMGSELTCPDLKGPAQAEAFGQ